MNESIDKKKKQRNIFLQKLYDLTGGSTSNPINGGEIAAQLDFTADNDNLLTDITKYIETEGLIKVVWIRGIPASVQLTHNGLKEVEKKQMSTNKQTRNSLNTILHDKRNMLKVFMCHSKEDKIQIRDFYNKLCLKGVDAWLDEEKILPGQDWQLEIEKAIRSSHIVLVFLSNNSVTKTGFIHKEIKKSLDVADEQPNGTIFIIPARLEELDVPETFRNLQWVDLFEVSGFEKLMKALEARAKELNLDFRNNSNKSQASFSIAGLDKNEIINLFKSIESPSNVIVIDDEISGVWEGNWKSNDGDNGKCHLELYKIEKDILGRASLESSVFSVFGKTYFKGKIENNST